MIPSKEILNKIKFLSENHNKIQVEEWEDVQGHKIVWILDRQKPSIEINWDFDEERLGITSEGKIVYGFDSGCSCPMPWGEQNYEDYYTEKTWKQLEIDLSDLEEFDYFEDSDVQRLDELILNLESVKCSYCKNELKEGEVHRRVYDDGGPARCTVDPEDDS